MRFRPGDAHPWEKTAPGSGRTYPFVSFGEVCAVVWMFSSQQMSAQDTEPALAPSSPAAFVCL